MADLATGRIPIVPQSVAIKAIWRCWSSVAWAIVFRTRNVTAKILIMIRVDSDRLGG
jgi:hypothetical protein